MVDSRTEERKLKRGLDALVVSEYCKHIQRLGNQPQGPRAAETGRIPRTSNDSVGLQPLE